MRPARYGYTRGWQRGVAALVDGCGRILERKRPIPRAVQSVLLIRLERFGDLILTLPMLDALRRRHPRASLTWLVRPVYADFLRQAVPGIEVVELRSGALRKRRFDVAYELHGHPRWIALARRHAAWVSGHGIRGAGFLLDHDSPLAGTAGIGSSMPPWLELTPAWSAAADAALGPQAEPFIVVHPGCGQPSKRWPEAQWREFLAQCAAHETPVILAGGPADQAVCAGLAAEGAVAAVLSGLTDWGTLAGLVARARAVVAPDTGIIHLARALGTPTVALFGPTDPARWAAAAGPRDRVLLHKLPCSHCDRGRCLHPAANPFSPCLQAISAIEAWQALAQLFEYSSSQRSPVSTGNSTSRLHSSHEPSYSRASIPAQRAAK